jgi:hypothetical protein
LKEFLNTDCITAYSTAFQYLPNLLWIGLSIPVRQDAIQRLDIGQATSNAVNTCIQLVNLNAAIEIMEQGLATVFHQVLQLKPDVEQLPTRYAELFRTLFTSNSK